MPTIFTRKKYNPLSTLTVILLSTASLIGLNACSSGGSSAPLPSVTVTGGSVVEGDAGTRVLTFTVNPSIATTSITTVNYATSDGTATAGTDYTAKSGTLTIPVGSTSTSITVDVTGDTAFEFDETITMTLSSPSGLTLGTATSGTGTITNDDDADTKGYFTGTATLDSVSLTDVRAIAYDNRLIVFSAASNDLYDIDITSVTGMNFAGTVEVYADGNLVQPSAVTITGTTNESQVQGTFVGGTGIAAGSFDILFDTQNNRGATLPRIEAQGASNWDGTLHGIDVDTGELASVSGRYTGTDDTTERCVFSVTASNFVIPDVNLNIYQMAHPIENQGIGSCSTTYESTGHTGFASVIDTVVTDDEVVFAFANGTFAMFGIMNH